MFNLKSITTPFFKNILYLLPIGILCGAAINFDSFYVVDSLFDQTDPDSLGLSVAEGTETYSVFEPTETSDQYSNGVVMTAFQGYLYCQWQSSATDEDAPDTWVAYSRSEDGINWSEPMELAPSISDGYSSSGGWWSTGDTLVAYINTWPESTSPRGGYTRYRVSTDGINWSEPKALPMANGDTLKGIFEQDPHALPDGRIISAAHFQPGLVVSPVYTDDSTGISGWIRPDFTNLSSGDVSRALEPSWFLRKDGAVVMTFRDQNQSYKRLASVSMDRGESWSKPELTNMPDSRSKQSAGNLYGDSLAFMVGNPVDNRTRIPLAIALSIDGEVFNAAYLLRAGGADLQPLRYEGLYKREGYHYPKSMVWNDHLYVSYATNKEDVEYTRVPISNFIVEEYINLAPEIANQTFTIDENPNNGTNIGTIQANDPENFTLIYKILSGNENGIFAIDSLSGLLSVADSSLLDFETQQSFDLVVEIRDSEGHTASAEITVELNDVDEIILSSRKPAHITVYPNPFHDYIIIDYEDFHKAAIYDLSGNLLLRSNESRINISNYPKGMYLISISGKNGEVFMRKVTKM